MSSSPSVIYHFSKCKLYQFDIAHARNKMTTATWYVEGASGNIHRRTQISSVDLSGESLRILHTAVFVFVFRHS